MVPVTLDPGLIMHTNVLKYMYIKTTVYMAINWLRSCGLFVDHNSMATVVSHWVHIVTCNIATVLVHVERTVVMELCSATPAACTS